MTKLRPPLPPQPQIPPTLALPQNPTPQEIDEAVNDDRVPVSYCTLLMDPNITAYDYIDVELRQTVYDCMFHRPKDRPTLETLLDQAKIGAKKRFPGEDDGYIRRWISRWI